MRLMEWIADRWEHTARDLRWALLAIAAGVPITVTLVILATTPGSQPPARPFVSPDTTATQTTSPIAEPGSASAPTASAPSPDLADTGSAPAQFSSCAQAHAAGVGQIPRSSTRYRTELDPDGDGIACETDPLVILLPTVVPFTAEPSPSPAPSVPPSATQSPEPTVTDPPVTTGAPTTVSEPPGPTSAPTSAPVTLP